MSSSAGLSRAPRPASCPPQGSTLFRGWRGRWRMCCGRTWPAGCRNLAGACRGAQAGHLAEGTDWPRGAEIGAAAVAEGAEREGRCDGTREGSDSSKTRRRLSNRNPSRERIPFPGRKHMRLDRMFELERRMTCRGETERDPPGKALERVEERDGAVGKVARADSPGGRRGLACAPNAERRLRTSAELPAFR